MSIAILTASIHEFTIAGPIRGVTYTGGNEGAAAASRGGRIENVTIATTTACAGLGPGKIALTHAMIMLMLSFNSMQNQGSVVETKVIHEAI